MKVWFLATLFLLGLSGNVAAQDATPIAQPSNYRAEWARITREFTAAQDHFEKLTQGTPTLPEWSEAVAGFLAIRDEAHALTPPAEFVASHALWVAAIDRGSVAAIASASGIMRNDAGQIERANQLWRESFDLMGMSGAIR